MRHMACALGALMLLACQGGSGVSGDFPDPVPVDTDRPDATGDGGEGDVPGPDVEPDEGPPDVPEDPGPGGDEGGDAEEDTGPVTVITVEQEQTGLSNEFVFKGLWGAPDGRAVAVGNNGVIVSRSAQGKWKILSEAEGADLLNAVHGTSADDLWAVGKDGAILRGDTSSFSSKAGCSIDADCDDGDSCTINACVGGFCEATQTFGEGCCGTRLAEHHFDGGELTGWTVVQEFGGATPATWQVLSHVDAFTGEPRYTSPEYALYFGDGTQSPPSLNVGERVAARATSAKLWMPGGGTAKLRFSVWMDAEAVFNKDTLTLEISAPSGKEVIWDKSDLPKIPTPEFVDVTIDLTPWMGQQISLIWRFDSIDAEKNLGEGVYVDDITIDTLCAEGNTAQLATLWDVHALSPSQVFAVGLQGTIAEWDGVNWTSVSGPGQSDQNWTAIHGDPEPGGRAFVVGAAGAIGELVGLGIIGQESPVATDLKAIHSADGQNWWAAGTGGVVMKASTPSMVWEVDPTPTAADMYGIHALGPFDVYAVGDFGTILHYDGFSWSFVTSPSSLTLRAVWASPSGLVTIVGDSGILLQGNATDGFTQIGAVFNGGELWGLWGTGESTLFAVGNASKIFYYDAGAWPEATTPTTPNLRGVWGAAANDVWAVGWLGTTLHHDGVDWTAVPTPTSTQLEGVWGRSSTEVYAVGAGAVLRWDGEDWSFLTVNVSSNLRGVYARNADEVWACGAGGTILRRVEQGWVLSPIEPIVYSDGTEEEIVDQLHAIWASGPDDAWAVGEAGRIVHWDGETWTNSDVEFGITLRDIYGTGPDDVWAVGNEGHVIHWDGESWTPIPTGSIATLYAIYPVGDDLMIAGDIGTFLRIRKTTE